MSSDGRDELLGRLLEVAAGEVDEAAAGEGDRALEADGEFRAEAAGLVEIDRLLLYAAYLERERPDLAAGVLKRLQCERDGAGAQGFSRQVLAHSAEMRPARLPRRWRLAAGALCAAAAALLLAVLLARVFGTPQPRLPEESAADTIATVFDNGTVLAHPRSSVVEILGARGETDTAVRLRSGELEVHAAKAAPGRRAVVVETRLGTVETLGTVFTVRLEGGEREAKREGDGPMTARKMGAITLAALFVSVMEGTVLVRGQFGAETAGAGETITVAEQGVKGTVSGVEVQSQTSCKVTVTLSAEGTQLGFEVTSRDGRWKGVVTELAADRATLHVGLPPGVEAPRVGEEVRVSVSTVVTKGEAGAEPAPVPAAADEAKAVNGLALTLVRKEGNEAAGGVAKGQTVTFAAAGGPAPVIFSQSGTILWRVRNAGDKPVILPMGFYYSGMKVLATDAAGATVPKRQVPVVQRTADGGDRERPVTIMILKPGQVIEQQLMAHTYGLALTEAGKYTVQVELELPEQPEVLPGFKPWSGKVVSNQAEIEITSVGKPSAGRGRQRGAPATDPTAAPADTEKF